MSEPQRIGEILPGVMADIKRRCEENPDNKDFPSPKDEHSARIRAATAEFLQNKKAAARRRRQTSPRGRAAKRENHKNTVSEKEKLWQ